MTAAHEPRPAPSPTAASGADNYVAVSRQALEAATELIAGGHDHDERLRAAAYQQGRREHLAGGYQEGFTLGHDTGLSARQDTRGYVHGILDGFSAGCDERQSLADHLRHRDQVAYIERTRSRDREAEAS